MEMEMGYQEMDISEGGEGKWAGGTRGEERRVGGGAYKESNVD